MGRGDRLRQPHGERGEHRAADHHDRGYEQILLLPLFFGTWSLVDRDPTAAVTQLTDVIELQRHYRREEQSNLQSLLDLSAALQAVVSQRLVRTKTGMRVPAVEVLLNTRHIAELIERGEINEIKDALEKSMSPGSQTFEQALFKLFMDGKITQDEAMANADSPTNMLWLINQATAGEITGQTPSGPLAPAGEPERKEGLLSAGEGASFGSFKIDANG